MAAASPMTAASPGASPGDVQTHADLGMIVEFVVEGETGTTDAAASPAAGSEAAASPAAAGAASPMPTAGS
jgi:hypothetical protein